MASRVWDRLCEIRRRRFVGRTQETLLFESVLASKQLPWQVLYIFGLGGVGKTTLLREFAYICQEAGTPVVYVDARNIEPYPESFYKALEVAAGVEFQINEPQRRRERREERGFAQDGLCDAIACHSGHYVVLIDTYEILISLEDWLLQVFLPQLPENALVVLAGRQPPSKAWRSDPGWQALTYTLELCNFSLEESCAYLSKRQIPEQQYECILNFTHGHPLALSLVADVFAQQGKFNFRPEAAPDVVKTLLEQFVQEVKSPLHRAALEVCALVRLTTEALLADTLGLDDVYDLFQWLRELSFIESGLHGVFPHDLVREAISTDLRWRNPERYAELFSRARTYYIKRIQQTEGAELERALFDYMFKSPQARQFFVWQDNSNLLSDSLRETDISALVAMVAKHEGEVSAKLAGQWLAKQPQGVLVFRCCEGGTPLGFMMMLALHEVNTEDLQLDPATQAVWNYIQQQGSLQPGEKATFCRFWMAADTYQAVSQIQSLINIKIFRHCVTTANLAFMFTALAEPDFWEFFCTRANTPLLPEAYFTVDGRQYGVCGHNYRVEPVMELLRSLPDWVLAMSPGLSSVNHSLEQIESVEVLRQSEFTTAVRQALRDVLRPEALRQNPLLNSPIVTKRIGSNTSTPERIATLQLILEQAIESLKRSPREAKFYCALYHTYLQPARSQEHAAEILDISIGSFRRHLKAGIARVTEILWHQQSEN